MGGDGVARATLIFSFFYLTNALRSVIILFMKSLINLYSIFVAKAFETLYFSDNYKTQQKALKVLDHYRSVRRCLPIMECGKHYGNHDGSSKKAFLATQGER